MTLDHPHRGRRTALAAAIACSAIAIVVPVDGAAHADPVCGTLGNLFTYELNDRCDFGTGDPLNVDTDIAVSALREAGLCATTVTCTDGSVVPVVAQPNEVLVSAPSRGLLTEAVAQVRRRLGTAAGEEPPEVINGLTARVPLLPGTIDDEFLQRRIATLQASRSAPT